MSYDSVTDDTDYSYLSEHAEVEGESLDISPKTDFDMTDDEKEELCKTFILLDEDGDGVLDPSDIGELLYKWGRMNAGEDLEDILSYADAKGCEGAIGVNFDGFRKYFAKQLKDTSNEKELRRCFEAFDSNPLTGKLNLTELRHYLKMTGMKLTDDEIDFLFREEDYWMLEEKNIFEYDQLVRKLLGKPYDSPFLKCS